MNFEVKLMRNDSCSKIMLFGTCDSVEYFYEWFFMSGCFIPRYYVDGTENEIIKGDYAGLFIESDYSTTCKMWIGNYDDTFRPVYNQLGEQIIYRDNDMENAIYMVDRIAHRQINLINAH